LTDTVAVLVKLSTASPGLYLVNSNARWNFYEIASALNERHGRRWKIVADDDFVFDQRMLDPRVPIRPLSVTLTALAQNS
jgi:dTDP-4-dehydrorhamnose reductase